MADEMAGMVTLTGTAMDAPDVTQAASADPGELVITENSAVGVYEATRDGVAVAGAVYNRTGDRVTLLATSVLPEFRGQGIAGRLLGGVLDKLRAEGATVILSCPFAAEFVAEHPEYAGVVAPGAARHSH